MFAPFPCNLHKFFTFFPYATGMKQFLASAALILVFGIYVLTRHMGGDDGAVAVIPPSSYQQQSSTDTSMPASSSQGTTPNASSFPDYTYQPTPASSVPSYPQQTSSTPPPPPPASSSAAPKGQYKDGTYTGVSADAFYGNIQVAVTIAGGKVSDVRFLDYPSDRGTSVMINQQAMPYLRQEAIQAQSAPVDIVSGATDSSGAFNQSLASALHQAKNS